MGTKKALKQVSSGREEICLQMLCKFLFDVRNRWYELHQFLTKEMQENRSENNLTFFPL